MTKVRLRDVDGQIMEWKSEKEAIESMAEALGMSYPIGLGEWSDTAT